MTLNSPTEDGKIESISENDKFILVMTDPDALSNSDHKWSEYLHWLVTDLKLPHTKNEDGEPEISHFIDVKEGRELVPYMGQDHHQRPENIVMCFYCTNKIQMLVN